MKTLIIIFTVIVCVLCVFSVVMVVLDLKRERKHEKESGNVVVIQQPGASTEAPTITPSQSGTLQVGVGQSAKFGIKNGKMTIYSKEGYRIVGVKRNGKEVAANEDGTYTVCASDKPSDDEE